MTSEPSSPEPNAAISGERDTPKRVVFWGTYDLGKPRTRILRDSLGEVGVEVIEVHADIWAKHEDKSQAGFRAILWTLLRGLIAYPRLIYGYLKAPAHDAVVVPYLGQFDVLILKPFVWARRRPVVWDMFISLYDTVVCDRRMLRPWNPVALALRALEWLSCRTVDLVLLDTKTHALRISDLFSLPQERVDAVPVGAEPAAFRRLARRVPGDGKTRILFYGQLIPLHGIETILDAALSEEGRAHEWHIIGSGQDGKLVEKKLHGQNAVHIQWEKWRPYEALIDAIEDADICLGIFGSSDKAGSVVPNKVYQCLMAGRTVITRKSEAISQTFPEPHAGLLLVDHADPHALIAGIEDAKNQGLPTMQKQDIAIARPADIGVRLKAILGNVCRESSRYG